MRIKKSSIMMLTALSMAVLLNGCGSSSKEGSVNLGDVPKVSESSCAQCHGSSFDSVTGKQIYTEYTLSAHFSDSVGCQGCHGGGAQHSGVGPMPFPDPSGSGQCFTCHGDNLPLSHTNPTALVAGDANPARYMSIGGTNCSACHDPHNPLEGKGKQERKDWAKSAHGDVEGLGWVHYDFTGPGRGSCSPCHTTEGFKRAVADGFVATSDLSTTSLGKKPLNCDACHSDYNFRLRELDANTDATTGGYIAKYGGFGATPKATVVYSNQGESNLCIPCHAGRENGDSLIAGNYNFTNQSFINPHYLTSAAVWQGVGGFKYYSSTARYGFNSPTHGVKTDDLISVARSFNSRMNEDQLAKGSCVACHLGLKDNHKFDTYSAVKYQFNTGAAVTGCLGCHSDTDNGRARYYPTANVASVATRLASGGNVQAVALDFLKWQLEQLGIKYVPAYPYFYMADGTTAVKNWTTQIPAAAVINPTAYANTLTDPQTLGMQTMGAAMNLATLLGDKGAAAHNANFARHIISDSLVFLQHGNVGDRSSTAAINNISFTAYSTAKTPVGGGLPIAGNPAGIGEMKAFLTTWKTDNSVQEYVRK